MNNGGEKKDGARSGNEAPRQREIAALEQGNQRIEKQQRNRDGQEWKLQRDRSAAAIRPQIQSADRQKKGFRADGIERDLRPLHAVEARRMGRSRLDLANLHAANWQNVGRRFVRPPESVERLQG